LIICASYWAPPSIIRLAGLRRPHPIQSNPKPFQYVLLWLTWNLAYFIYISISFSYLLPIRQSNENDQKINRFFRNFVLMFYRHSPPDYRSTTNNNSYPYHAIFSRTCVCPVCCTSCARTPHTISSELHHPLPRRTMQSFRRCRIPDWF